MRSSGQLLESHDRHVECAETLHVNGTAYPTGCRFIGWVEVWFDPEESTDEVFWTCPACAMDHTDLIRG